MEVRATHTYSLLEVSIAAYNEIKALLIEANYDNAINTTTGEIDMHCLALVSSADKVNPRIEQLESYLDKTRDGLLVVECEILYCPKCGGEVELFPSVNYCCNCPNPDSGNEPPLPLLDGSCFGAKPTPDQLDAAF